jgi:PAS domain S-box-containing protein
VATSIGALLVDILLFGFLIAYSVRSGEEEWRNSVLRVATLARNAIEPELADFRAGRLSRAEAIEALRRKIRSMKYRDEGGDNYVFMGDFENRILVLPFNPEDELVGPEERDPLNRAVSALVVAAARSHPEGSFVKYDYIPPGGGRPEPKLSYVIGIPELEALLGTGRYLDAAAARRNAIIFAAAAASLAVLGLHLLSVRIAFLAYARSNRDLATVLDSISDAILVHDEEARIIRANRAAEELLDSGSAKLEGLNIRDVSAEAPDLEGRIRYHIAEDSGDASPRFDWKFKRLSDGAVFDVDVSLRRTMWEGRLAFVSVVRDARQRRRLVEYAAWLDAIFLNVPLPFWAVDAEGRFVLQSAASVERLGELVGRRLEDALERIRTPIERIEAAAAGETFVGERVEGTAEGERFLIETLAPVPGMGEGSGILCIEIDISERVRAENEARRLNRELEKRVEERTKALVGYEKLAAIGRLAAGVAHELNTPLGAALSAAESLSSEIRSIASFLPDQLGDLDSEARAALRSLLEAPVAFGAVGSAERGLRSALSSELGAMGLPDPYAAAEDLVGLGVADPKDPRVPLLAKPEYSEALAKASRAAGALRLVSVIRDAAERAALTVRALRSYSYHEAEGELRELDVSRQIDDILTLFRNSIKHGVEVERRYEGDPVILGNAESLNQVWMNLVKNALQAMQYSGRLEVGVRGGDGSLEAWIADSGPGIPESVKPRIFEPFFTTKEPGEGTGLGLELCRKSVELHGGSIRFESEPGRTVFYVRLPRRPPERA